MCATEVQNRWNLDKQNLILMVRHCSLINRKDYFLIRLLYHPHGHTAGYGLTELNQENWLVWVPVRPALAHRKNLSNTLILFVYNSTKIIQDSHTCTTLRAATTSERPSALHWQAWSFIWTGPSCEAGNVLDLQILSIDGDYFKLHLSVQKWSFKKKKKRVKIFFKYLTNIDMFVLFLKKSCTAKGIILQGYLNAYFKGTSPQGKIA